MKTLIKNHNLFTTFLINNKIEVENVDVKQGCEKPINEILLNLKK